MSLIGEIADLIAAIKADFSALAARVTTLESGGGGGGSGFITAVRTGTATRTSNAFVADDQLVSPELEANSIYRIELVLLFTGGVAEDMRFRVGRTGLADADLRFASDLDNASAPTLPFANGTSGGAVNCAVAAAGTLYMGNYIGVLKTGAASGTVHVEWGQQTTGATPAELRAGSMLLLRKVA